jgi:hypothetical protein
LCCCRTAPARTSSTASRTTSSMMSPGFSKVRLPLQGH